MISKKINLINILQKIKKIEKYKILNKSNIIGVSLEQNEHLSFLSINNDNIEYLTSLFSKNISLKKENSKELTNLIFLEYTLLSNLKPNNNLKILNNTLICFNQFNFFRLFFLSLSNSIFTKTIHNGLNCKLNFTGKVFFKNYKKKQSYKKTQINIFIFELQKFWNISYSTLFSKLNLKLRKYRFFPITNFICLKPIKKYKNTNYYFILYKMFILKKKLRISSKINNLKSNLIFLNIILKSNVFSLLLYSLNSKDIDKNYKFSIINITKIKLNFYINLIYLQKLSLIK